MDLLNLLKAALLGVVQGVTEWLPISSTGHMILLDELLALNASAEFKSMFRVVIQLGSILAVLVLYFDRLNPLSTRKSAGEKRSCLTLWAKILLAAVPAGIAGVLLDDWFDAHLYNYITVAVALIVYGAAFIVIERAHRGKAPRYARAEDITPPAALGIGCFQVLSLIPGTSRSGSTILGAVLIGASRTAGAEFSFFLALPVMCGASLLKLVKFGFAFTLEEAALLATGTLVAFAVSLAAIRFLISFVQRHSFEAFGWYRIALGAAVLLAAFITK